MLNDKKSVRFKTLLSMFVLLLFVGSIQAESLYFVGYAPVEDYRWDAGRTPAIIYEFDTLNYSIKEVWSSDAPNWLNEVHIIEETGETFIGVSNVVYSRPSKLHHFYADSSISKKRIIESEHGDKGMFSRYDYYRDSNINLLSTRVGKRGEKERSQLTINLNTSKIARIDKSMSEYSKVIPGKRTRYDDKSIGFVAVNLKIDKYLTYLDVEPINKSGLSPKKWTQS